MSFFGRSPQQLVRRLKGGRISKTYTWNVHEIFRFALNDKEGENIYK